MKISDPDFYLCGPPRKLKHYPEAKSAYLVPVPIVSGVYLLLDEEKRVIYIGKSVNTPSRVRAHKTRGWSDALYVPCPVEDLDMLEGALIRYFDPPQNGHRMQPKNRSSNPGDPAQDAIYLRRYGFNTSPTSLEKAA